MSVTLLNPYVTLADVKNYCGIDSQNTKHDERIKWAINKASRYIDDTTLRFFYKKTYTSEYLSATKSYQGWQLVKSDTGGLIHTPKLAPIISVATLSQGGTALTENTDYFVDKENGIIEKASGNWSEEPREIIITAEIGYDTDDTETPSSDLPGNIVMYALELASRFSGEYKKTIKNYVSGASEAIDLYGVPKEVKQALLDLRPVGLA